ncbi:FAD-dependent monooxygenase [Longispora sp. NPDC051575]|uniref:FAD-dependent monooxygenase n=1 Tax=Longispora sp. NPDC051575 TaxID=3154943 RepID=UPI00344A443A
MTEVLIAGAGPTGLMLACELRTAGVDVLVLDRLPGRGGESRAGGLHARTLEVLDQRGMLAPFLAAGREVAATHFSALWLDISGFQTRYPYTLMLVQTEVERLLAERLAALGGRVRWSAEVVGVRQDADGVDVELGGGERIRARYLVGCDGGRSTVRKVAGIDFPGTPATLTALLADVRLTDPPTGLVFQERREHGDYSVLRFGPDWYRVMTTQHDRVADRDAPVTFEDVRAAMLRIAGTDHGMHSPSWVSRFGDAARQASRYREGRILLAGDAAHIHYPAGGQGLNTGVQDAVNLGWKLAAAVRGHSPAGGRDLEAADGRDHHLLARWADDLLDSYGAERHPVAERVLDNTRAQTALARPGPHTDALRATFRDLIGMAEVNRSLTGMITALDLRYDLGEGHPLVGRRVPDVDLKSAGGDLRLFELLHAARPVFLDLGGAPGCAEVAGEWAVTVVEARSAEDAWGIPVIGEVPVPGAVLIRPDGHVAWAGGSVPELRAALGRWCAPLVETRSGGAA